MRQLPPIDRPIRLAVLISGGGTTLLNLQKQITAGELSAEIVCAIADRPCSGIERSQAVGVDVELIPYESAETTSQSFFDRFRAAKADLVVMAGFLQRILIPEDFEHRVMNIHPSLIPAFCGKGMYGHHVHQAVIERGCQFSGCTVHFCDNVYDNGPIILQRTVPVLPQDDADALAARVFEQECVAYPEAIRQFASGKMIVEGRRIWSAD